jgi:hypothetical protein
MVPDFPVPNMVLDGGLFALPSPLERFSVKPRASGLPERI